MLTSPCFTHLFHTAQDVQQNARDLRVCESKNAQANAGDEVKVNDIVSVSKDGSRWMTS